jgi:uncharacterized membrane protein
VSALPSLAGLALIAALVPLRSSWAAALALVILCLVVPGVIALRAVRVPTDAILRFPVYIVAASLFVIIAGGLLADLVGPSVGVARPLHGLATAFTVLGVSTVLWLIGLTSPDAARLPWSSLLRRPSLLLGLAVPALAAIGALLLTNGHGPVVARIGACVTVATLIGVVIFAHRLTRGQVALLLFAASLAAEWAFSIRSQEIVGFDISTEIHVAQHTQAVGIWHQLNRNNAYSAMLSLTVLPSTLAALTGLSPLIAFKVLFPAIAALFPLTAYFLGDRIVSPGFAAGAAALIIAQNYFFQLMPQLARQEIGLLFFAALLVAMLDVRLRRGPRLVLIVIFAAGLIVSHYSSAYLAIAAVVIAVVLHAVVGRFRDGLAVISLPWATAAVVLIGGAALWYGALTHSASNLSSFASSLNKSGLDLLPARNGNIVNSYLNGNLVQGVSATTFEQLAVEDYRSRSAYIQPLPQAGEPQYAVRDASVPTPATRLAPLGLLIKIVATAVDELMLVAGVIGAVILGVRRRGDLRARMIGLLSFATVAVLGVIRFSGTAAAAYNQQRALLQSLILLTVTAAWLAEAAVWRLKRAQLPVELGLVAALGVLFAYQSGLSALVVGGGTSLNLSQSGEDFERQYTTPAELAGATWATDASGRQLLYADRYGQLRLFASSGRLALTDVTPETIDRYAWIYGTRTNVVLGRTRGEIGNDSSLYAWPNRFLNDYFNVVYSNGDSKVYHR